ncbi:MAG: 23S rRNA (uracil(1939)-C(5))-methyltransferase RlmD [Ruminococcaceae bacterium]|nr:23S rRNA (uracil(1939)-C(5))-methyltransferase RlmD [Oscillospiraceae bacterium]
MQKNEIIHLCIEEINNLGFGVGHTGDGQVVFVRDAVTGDELDARIIKVNRSYLIARIERMHKASALRAADACPVAGCGGCVYQQIGYGHELYLKREYVKNAFRKAGLSEVKVKDVLSTHVLCGYRNKAQYPVANGKNGMQAGFFATGTHRIVPTEHCRLQPSVFSQIVGEVCSFCDRHAIRAYDEESGKGCLRHIYLRMGVGTGEIMLCLVVNGSTFPRERELCRVLSSRFKDLRSIMINVNTQSTNVVLGDTYRCLFGRDWIEDKLLGNIYRISAGAFYQVNHDACELLYTEARKQARLTKGDTVLDLYCGIGTIGLSMADHAGRIIGIEIVEEAVERARENARQNGIENAFFYCGDASDARGLLTRAEEAHGDVSGAVVIMDPPRKGSTPELISYLAERNFSRIVYVSCGPDTLARDCVLFKELGYEIGEVTPVDLFPRTGHVESVVCLTRRLDNELPMA